MWRGVGLENVVEGEVAWLRVMITHRRVVESTL